MSTRLRSGLRLKAGLLLAFAVAAAAATTVAMAGPTYRWVDADGIHYSDQPHPGAEKVFLGQSQTYTAVPAAPLATPRAKKPVTDPATGDADQFRYDSCSVVQPSNDQVISESQSTAVVIQLQPAKRASDRVVLSYDGRSIEPVSSDQTTFQISPLDRGTHTAAASVRDTSGKSLCQATAVTFHVRQPSVFTPLNPNRRH